MPVSRLFIATIIVAIGVAAGCARLGLWQLDRLAERRAYNAVLMSRLSEPELSETVLPADTGVGHYRRVQVTGVLQYTREIAWAPRMRKGSPGVNVLTPLAIAGSDTLLMLNRGWVYSPDAKTVDLSRWREGDTVSVAGYVETWPHQCLSDSADLIPLGCADSATRTLRRLDRRAAERLVGAPIAPYLLMQTSDSALRADSVPARVETPVLDEGPHANYAFQWFAFAAIALIGGGVLARKVQSG
ncbi:MAG: SURF1 family protein [Gemmatimonadetes bacterium]|nr:SURF1 family protein [Gemmatimonadota bacterium]